MVFKNLNKVFKPLEPCQQVLSYISVCSVEENISKWKKLAFKVFPFIIFATNLMSVSGSILFFWRFISTDLEKCLIALYQIAGALGLMYSIIVTFITHSKLLAMIESLEKIYRASDQCKNFL